MVQKVKKVRINQEQKFEIIKICLDYVYKTEKWDEFLKKYEEKQNNFKDIIRSFYKKYFDITEDIENFSKEYGINGIYLLRLRDNCFIALKKSKELHINTFKKFSIDKCLRYENSFFDNRIELPFYNSLHWRELTSFNRPLPNSKDCHCIDDYMDKMFTQYMVTTYNNFEKKQKESITILSDMIKILNSCLYQNEVKELLPIPEVIKYIDTLDTKKISTALCTLDLEKVDFIKNYIKSQK